MLMLAIITRARSYPNAKRPFHCQRSHLLNTPTTTPPKTYSWLSATEYYDRVAPSLQTSKMQKYISCLKQKKGQQKTERGCEHELVRESREWESVGRNKNGRGKEEKKP